MSHTRHMDESEDESENSEDRAFIASSDDESDGEGSDDETENKIQQKIELEKRDDTVDALIEGMDKQTLLLYQQSLAEETDASANTDNAPVRRSKRKRKRNKTWFDLHPEDVRIFLEDENPQDICNAEFEQTPEPTNDTESSYEPTDDES